MLVCKKAKEPVEQRRTGALESCAICQATIELDSPFSVYSYINGLGYVDTNKEECRKEYDLEELRRTA